MKLGIILLSYVALLTSFLVLAVPLDSGDEEEWVSWLRDSPQSPEKHSTLPGPHIVNEHTPLASTHSGKNMPDMETSLGHLPLERELDQSDFAFLDSIASELSERERSINPNDAAQRSPASALGAQLQSSPRAREPATGKRARNTVQDQTSRSVRLRKKQNWPAPRVFSELESFPELRKQGVYARLSYTEDPGLRSRIDSVFANKIHWVDLKSLPISEYNFRKRMPTLHVHSRVPSVQTVDKNGQRFGIYMTEHNILKDKRHTGLDRSPLQDVPHFMFWKVADNIKGVHNEIEYLGTGYINKEDNGAVDRHVRGLLEAAKHSSGAHL